MPQEEKKKRKEERKGGENVRRQDGNVDARRSLPNTNVMAFPPGKRKKGGKKKKKGEEKSPRTHQSRAPVDLPMTVLLRPSPTA